MRVVSRPDASVAKGRVLQGVHMSLVGISCELELCRIPISMVVVEFSKSIGGIWPKGITGTGGQTV